jgi:hypothetical protein
LEKEADMAYAEPRILPMKTAGTQHLIDRTYREGGPFQWVRETLTNALEAGASRVEFGIEWQAVESMGVYRRVISDNGCGMTADELVAFFNTFGGGGKPIGGVHENFGVGAKTSLLPWNRHGMVVISWVDGEPSMIWVRHDAGSGEYGLKLEEVVDPATGETSLDEVYEPYPDDDHGCDWAALKPEWIEDQGTVIVLLGNDGTYDTVLGDPTRPEADIKGISSYLNRRLWEVPSGVEITVDELGTQDRSQWPTSEDSAHPRRGDPPTQRRTYRRTIQGARHFVEYPLDRFKGGRLKASGTRTLRDGTDVDWYLWDGERPAVGSYAALGGFIAALYRNELYDVTSHNSTYRSFGVTEAVVRSRLWLIVRPPELGEDKGGVYPRTDRNALLLRGGPNAGGPLPINEWANEFADSMPPEILAAIKAARTGSTGTLSDDGWRQRLADRFGARWRIPRLRARKGGALSVEALQPGTQSVKTKARKRQRSEGGGCSGGREGEPNTGRAPGPTPAVESKLAGGIPHYRAVGKDDLEPGMLAAWHPNDPFFREGAVLLNVEHPVLEEEIEHWQSQYPDHYADDIRQEVIDAYGQIAVAKVAHSEHLKGVLPSRRVEDELRSDAALTMSLLGLIGEEAVIAPRIGGKYKRRTAA